MHPLCLCLCEDLLCARHLLDSESKAIQGSKASRTTTCQSIKAAERRTGGRRTNSTRALGGGKWLSKGHMRYEALKESGKSRDSRNCAWAGGKCSKEGKGNKQEGEDREGGLEGNVRLPAWDVAKGGLRAQEELPRDSKELSSVSDCQMGPRGG